MTSDCCFPLQVLGGVSQSWKLFLALERRKVVTFPPQKWTSESYELITHHDIETKQVRKLCIQQLLAGDMMGI